MGTRGRRSKADIEAQVVEVQFNRRPEPPEALSDEEGAIWRAVVNTEPADFFGTEALRGMLADYCRHRSSAEKISEIIREFKSEWLKNAEGAKRYGGLVRMRDLETRAAAGMATKLRLTNQSRYTPQAAATAARNAPRGKKPWEE